MKIEELMELIHYNTALPSKVPAPNKALFLIRPTAWIFFTGANTVERLLSIGKDILKPKRCGLRENHFEM